MKFYIDIYFWKYLCFTKVLNKNSMVVVLTRKMTLEGAVMITIQKNHVKFVWKLRIEKYNCDPLRRNETCPPDLTFIDMYTRLTSNSQAFQ